MLDVKLKRYIKNVICKVELNVMFNPGYDGVITGVNHLMTLCTPSGKLKCLIYSMYLVKDMNHIMITCKK